MKGPASEDILIPVCLPPGFELGSLVLKPSFLPDEEQPRSRSSPGRRPSGRPASPAPAPPTERCGSPRRGVQLVYSGGVRLPHRGGEGLARSLRQSS